MAEEGSRLARRFLEGRSDAARRVEGWVRTAASPFRRRLDRGRGDDWEDAVQVGLVEVTRALREDRVRDLGRLRAWVFRSTTHTCLDRVRALRRWSWIEIDATDLGEPPSALGRLLEGSTVRELLPESMRLRGSAAEPPAERLRGAGHSLAVVPADAPPGAEALATYRLRSQAP